MALKIRIAVLHKARGNTYKSPEFSTENEPILSEGEFPKSIKKVLLEELSKQKSIFAPQVHRPCFVDPAIMSPTDLVLNLQKAAAGVISTKPENDDPKLPTPPTHLRGKPWHTVLNYKSDMIPLLASLEKWYSELETVKDTLPRQTVSSLGFNSVNLNLKSDRYKITAFQTLELNGLMSSDANITNFDKMTCLKALHVQALMPEERDATSSLVLLDELQSSFPFENARIFYSKNSYLLNAALKPGGLLESRPTFTSLWLMESHPNDLERSEVIKRIGGRFNHLIVSTAWFKEAGIDFLKKVFPNLKSLELIDNSLSQWGLTNEKSIFPNQEPSQIKRIAAFNDRLLELNSTGIRNLSIQTKIARTLLPRLNPLENITRVVVQARDHQPSLPCKTHGDIGDGFDIAQLARVFPKAKNVWIRSSRVLETEAAYSHFKAPVAWENLDFSNCTPNTKDFKLVLPKGVFPKLVPPRYFSCMLPIQSVLNLSRMAFDPNALFDEPLQANEGP